MTHVIDLGAAPAHENCAQLGRSPDFDMLNRLEIETYKHALVARHGPPPAGCRFTLRVNHHDFGTYRELGLRLDDDADEAAQDYAERVEEGLATWSEAGFRAPVSYDGPLPVVVHASAGDAVIAALMTTRPSPDGSYPIPDFATLHANLAAAFPAEVGAARARLAGTPSA